MYKIMFCSLSLLALTACQNTPDTNWAADCEKYSSYDSREYDQCLKRNPNRTSSGVSIDPNDTERTAEQDLGKGSR